MSELKADIEAAVGAPEALRITGLLERLLDAARREMERLGCEHADEIISAVLTTYDVLSKKVDIPWLPEPLESMLEAALGRVLAEVLQAMKKRICGESIT